MTQRGKLPVLGIDHPVVGMVHVWALPGTPRCTDTIGRIVSVAEEEARILVEGGVDAIMIENMHDVPYMNRTVGPEIVAGMTAVGRAIRESVDVPLGVQVLAGANREALAVAQASGASFIRAEGFVFSHVADEGLMPVADAGPLLRYRKQIGAEDVSIWADIKKKHSSHAITADVGLSETAHAAEFCGADVLIVTGVATGMPTDANDAQAVGESCDLPVVAGSGVTAENLSDIWEYVDGFIVGSSLKEGGDWMNSPEPARVEEFMRVVQSMR